MGLTLSFAALLLIVLLIQGHRNETLIAREWQLILEPWADRRLRSAEQLVNGQAGMIDRVYQLADDAWRARSYEEAQSRLRAGLRLVETSAVRLGRFIAAVHTLSRMADAVAPTRPLRMADFQLARLKGWAGFGQLLHHLLVTTGERLRLRAWLLGRALPILVKAFREGGERREWARIRAAREDLRTTSAETLACLHAALVSHCATPRAQENPRVVWP